VLELRSARDLARDTEDAENTNTARPLVEEDAPRLNLVREDAENTRDVKPSPPVETPVEESAEEEESVPECAKERSPRLPREPRDNNHQASL
jgi:hypothetical protein